MKYKRVDDNLLVCKLSAEEVEDLNLDEILDLMHEIGPNPEISQILGQIAYEPIMKTGFTKDVVIEVRDEDDEHTREGEVILYVWDRKWFEKQIEDEEKENRPYLEGTGPANTDNDIFPYIDMVFNNIFDATEILFAIKRGEWGKYGEDLYINFIKEDKKYHIVFYIPDLLTKQSIILKLSEQNNAYYFCDETGISKTYEHGEIIA